MDDPYQDLPDCCCKGQEENIKLRSAVSDLSEMVARLEFQLSGAADYIHDDGEEEISEHLFGLCNEAKKMLKNLEI